MEVLNFDVLMYLINWGSHIWHTTCLVKLENKQKIVKYNWHCLQKTQLDL